MATKSDADKFLYTSGAADPVWVKLVPPDTYPRYQSLSQDIETDVCIIGAGIAGISLAYELINRGREVVLLDAREVISGETSRTSGHLSNALDDWYTYIKEKHGQSGAQAAADSHTWALNRVGEIANKLGVQCEYRHLPGFMVSQYQRGAKEHDNDVKSIKNEAHLAASLGIEASFDNNLAVKGWDGKPDQRGGATFANQATFHPTQYLTGVLRWLQEQPNFRCFTHTRVMSVEEKGIQLLGLGQKHVEIKTESGSTVQCGHAVEATCVPLQKLSIIAQEEYNRTYCIAIRVPKGSVQDCLLYDTNDPYIYVRITQCDDKDDYLVVGGCDHKVGQEPYDERFEDLERWTRDRFTGADKVDYKWSGQIYEPVDYMAFIGKNQGNERIYVVTGDSGNGLTHGVLAGKLLADEIEGKSNPWASLYSPKRMASMAKSIPSMLEHDVEINMQYKRFLQSDIDDIEDLAPGTGGVLNSKTATPVAVYKDGKGSVTKMSALCPHMKGVVCWNETEKSFDCPVHGSRFSEKGLCVNGPAKANLQPAQ